MRVRSHNRLSAAFGSCFKINSQSILLESGHYAPLQLADCHLCSQGRNVVLESKYGSPRIVNDGVTVAKEVDLEDPVENIGARLVRQVGLIKIWGHLSTG